MMKSLALTILALGTQMTFATVQPADVQSPQPHPLPFSKVSSYADHSVCIVRDEPGAKELCLLKQDEFQPTQIKKDDQLALPANLAGFQGYVDQMSKQDERVLKFLSGTLAICSDYKVVNYYKAPSDNASNATTPERYALEVEFAVRGDTFSHRIFVLGTVSTTADQQRVLTYDGLADYDNMLAKLEASKLWERTFGLPQNGKKEDMPKFTKRGAGFVAPYVLDYMLSEKVVNPDLK